MAGAVEQQSFREIYWAIARRYFVAALALLLDRALEKSLHATGSSLSTPFAWQALEKVRYVEVEPGPRRKICVTRGNQHATAVLRALGIGELDPPSPPQARETLMQ